MPNLTTAPIVNQRRKTNQVMFDNVGVQFPTEAYRRQLEAELTVEDMRRHRADSREAQARANFFLAALIVSSLIYVLGYTAFVIWVTR